MMGEGDDCAQTSMLAAAITATARTATMIRTTMIEVAESRFGREREGERERRERERRKGKKPTKSVSCLRSPFLAGGRGRDGERGFVSWL